MSSTISFLDSKTLYTTTNPYEAKFGYHRAIRRGPIIAVSGTTSISPSTQKLLHPGNAYLQTITAFRESLAATTALGGRIEDVIRVRMFVANQEDCEDVGKALNEVFGNGCEEAGVAATMIVLGKGGFVDSEMLVEVELEAYVI